MYHVEEVPQLFTQGMEVLMSDRRLIVTLAIVLVNQEE